MLHPPSATSLATSLPESRPRGARIAGALRAVLAAAGRRFRLRRERRRLEALDGRTLADLGLRRGGLEGAARFGRGERPPSPPEAERSPPPGRGPLPYSQPPSSRSTTWRITAIPSGPSLRQVK